MTLFWLVALMGLVPFAQVAATASSPAPSCCPAAVPGQCTGYEACPATHPWEWSGVPFYGDPNLGCCRDVPADDATTLCGGNGVCTRKEDCATLTTLSAAGDYGTCGQRDGFVCCAAPNRVSSSSWRAWRTQSDGSDIEAAFLAADTAQSTAAQIQRIASDIAISVNNMLTFRNTAQASANTANTNANNANTSATNAQAAYAAASANVAAAQSAVDAASLQLLTAEAAAQVATANTEHGVACAASLAAAAQSDSTLAPRAAEAQGLLAGLQSSASAALTALNDARVAKQQADAALATATTALSSAQTAANSAISQAMTARTAATNAQNRAATNQAIYVNITELNARSVSIYAAAQARADEAMEHANNVVAANDVATGLAERLAAEACLAVVQTFLAEIQPIHPQAAQYQATANTINSQTTAFRTQSQTANTAASAALTTATNAAASATAAASSAASFATTVNAMSTAVVTSAAAATTASAEICTLALAATSTTTQAASTDASTVASTTSPTSESPTSSPPVETTTVTGNDPTASGTAESTTHSTATVTDTTQSAAVTSYPTTTADSATTAEETTPTIDASTTVSDAPSTQTASVEETTDVPPTSSEPATSDEPSDEPTSTPSTPAPTLTHTCGCRENPFLRHDEAMALFAASGIAVTLERHYPGCTNPVAGCLCLSRVRTSTVLAIIGVFEGTGCGLTLVEGLEPGHATHFGLLHTRGGHVLGVKGSACVDRAVRLGTAVAGGRRRGFSRACVESFAHATSVWCGTAGGVWVAACQTWAGVDRTREPYECGDAETLATCATVVNSLQYGDGTRVFGDDAGYVLRHASACPCDGAGAVRAGGPFVVSEAVFAGVQAYVRQDARLADAVAVLLNDVDFAALPYETTSACVVSGLAARLELHRRGVELTDVDEEQLAAWQLFGAPCAASDFTKEPAPEASVCRSRVGLVLDASASMGSSNFNAGRSALRDFARSAQLSANSLVSLVTFGASARVNFNWTTPSYAGNLVGAAAYVGGWTYTHAGLAASAALYPAGGASTAGELPVMIVVTNGRSSNAGALAAQLAQLPAGIVRYAVGVGSRVSTGELRSIAGSSRRVYRASSFNRLSRTLAKLLAALCAEPRPAPPPSSPRPGCASCQSVQQLQRNERRQFTIAVSSGGLVVVTLKPKGGCATLYVSTSSATPGPSCYEARATTCAGRGFGSTLSVKARGGWGGEFWKLRIQRWLATGALPGPEAFAQVRRFRALDAASGAKVVYATAVAEEDDAATSEAAFDLAVEEQPAPQYAFEVTAAVPPATTTAPVTTTTATNPAGGSPVSGGNGVAAGGPDGAGAEGDAGPGQRPVGAGGVNDAAPTASATAAAANAAVTFPKASSSSVALVSSMVLVVITSVLVW